MPEAIEIFTTLDELIDRWCERRALGPLRIILRAYTLSNNLTDGWQQLYDAVRDIRYLCKTCLTDDEQQKIGQLIIALQAGLDNR